MNLLKCLQTDGVKILRAHQDNKDTMDTAYLSKIPYLHDNEHELIYFVHFADEMPKIGTPFGAFNYFGKLGFEKRYFVMDDAGAVFIYDFMDDAQLIFANSSLERFYQSYCRYMACIFMCKACDDFSADAIERVGQFVTAIDPKAMALEENYWASQLYILEDGFAHLSHNIVSRMIGMPRHNYEK